MKNQSLTENKWIQFLITCILAITGGFFFQMIHMPIPWLLGSMIFVLIGSKLFKTIKPFWPSMIRNTGMGITGYTIGLSFTMSTLKQIGHQLPSMVLLTGLLLLCTFVIAFYVSKLSGIPFPTVLIGSIPGGLSQMIPLAEEIKGIDVTVVTFLQVSRLMMIIFFVPLLIFSPLFEIQSNAVLPGSIHTATASWGELFPHILVFALVCTICALLGKKIKFPTPFLLGPMIATIVLDLSGFHGPALPSVILNSSQLMIGGYIGLLLKPENLKHKFKIILLTFMSGVVLIACSIGLSILLTKLHTVTLVTSFLSLSPGGMDQMAIIAREVKADLSVVICYQLFRTFFIFLVVPSLLKAIFKTLKMHISNEGDPKGR
jgi:membrane AbrB-like protein